MPLSRFLSFFGSGIPALPSMPSQNYLNPSAPSAKAGGNPAASGLTEDVANLITSFFGEKTGELIRSMYDDSHPEELIGAAEDMISKLLGPENAKKNLQGIYSKYDKALNKR